MPGCLCWVNCLDCCPHYIDVTWNAADETTPPTMKSNLTLKQPPLLLSFSLVNDDGHGHVCACRSTLKNVQRGAVRRRCRPCYIFLACFACFRRSPHCSLATIPAAAAAAALWLLMHHRDMLLMPVLPTDDYLLSLTKTCPRTRTPDRNWMHFVG